MTEPLKNNHLVWVSACTTSTRCAEPSTAGREIALLTGRKKTSLERRVCPEYQSEQFLLNSSHHGELTCL